jgi:hypothetical protein
VENQLVVNAWDYFWAPKMCTKKKKKCTGERKASLVNGVGEIHMQTIET